MSPLLPMGVLAAGLAAVLALEIEATAPAPDARPAGAAPVPKAQAGGAAADAPAAPDAAALDTAVETILARPLFVPGRRPPEEKTAEAQGPAAAETLPRLAGLIITPSDRRAIFAPPGGKPLVAAEGARVGGYLLKRIGPDAVTLSGAGGEQVLRPTHLTQGKP